MERKYRKRGRRDCVGILGDYIKSSFCEREGEKESERR